LSGASLANDEQTKRGGNQTIAGEYFIVWTRGNSKGNSAAKGRAGSHEAQRSSAATNLMDGSSQARKKRPLCPLGESRAADNNQRPAEIYQGPGSAQDAEGNDQEVLRSV